MIKDNPKSYSVILPVLLFLFFVACNGETNVDDKQSFPENSKITRLELVDSLGMIELFVPLDYDTSFLWIHYSDCGKPCNEQKYRFQPKGFPVIKETGWYSKETLTDSINRLTISHSSFFPLQEDERNVDSIRHKYLKEQLKSDPTNPPIIFDTIQEVNNRYYSIIIMDKPDTANSKKVFAATTIKSNIVKFQYELVTRKNDSITCNFIKNSMELIKTIHINK